MDLRRSLAAAAAAIVAAAVPGAIRLLPAQRAMDRVTATVVPAAYVPPASGATPVAPPPPELVGAPAPAAPPPAGFAADRGEGQVFALVVGIDDYPGTSADLDWATADAAAVDAALDGFGVPPEHRMVLRDGQARRAVLEDAIRALAAQGGPDSTLVFAFAGHVRKLGPDREAMVTAEGDLLTDLDLAALLADARGDVWLLMASCYGAGFTEALAPGRVLTAAAGADDLAWESPAVSGSYLVHHLVREGWLEGRAGPTVHEAFAWADARLRDHPELRPVQVDMSTEPIRLGAPFAAPPADPPPPVVGLPGPGGPPAPPPDPAPEPATAASVPGRPPAEDERRCTLIVLCG